MKSFCSAKDAIKGMKDKAWIEKHIAQNMQKNLKTQQ